MDIKLEGNFRQAGRLPISIGTEDIMLANIIPQMNTVDIEG